MTVQLTPNVAELERTLRELADIGPGWAGTAGEGRRCSYVQQRLQDAGYEVTTEEFAYLATDAEATSSCVSDVVGTVPSLPVQYTAAGDAQGRLVAVGQGRPDDLAAFDQAGVVLDGAVALVRTFAPFSVIPELVARGAAGVIVQADTADDLIPHYAGRGFPAPLMPPWEGAYAPIPGVVVSRTTGDLLLAAHAGGAQVRLAHQTSYREATSANLVATTDPAAERFVVLAAHYDTQLAGGVWDNGTGLTVLLELARQLHGEADAGCAVRFVIVGCEEQLMWGSHHYVERHADELERGCVAMMNWDSPSAGYPVKNTCWCSTSMREVCEAASRACDWPVHVWEGEDFALTDSAPFAQHGIPTIWFWQHPPVHPYYHSKGDTLDLIDFDRLAEVARVGAHALEQLLGRDGGAP